MIVTWTRVGVEEKGREGTSLIHFKLKAMGFSDRLEEGLERKVQDDSKVGQVGFCFALFFVLVF